MDLRGKLRHCTTSSASLLERFSGIYSYSSLRGSGCKYPALGFESFGGGSCQGPGPYILRVSCNSPVDPDPVYF